MALPNNTLLILKNISKNDGDTPILKSFSLTVKSCEVVAITGMEDVLKNTLIALLRKKMIPDSGSIMTSLSGHQKNSSFDSDIFLLSDIPFPLITFSLIEIFVHNANKAGRAINFDAARQFLLESGVPYREQRLSANKITPLLQQKVSLALAFAFQASVLIVDDPFFKQDASYHPVFSNMIQAAVDRKMAILILAKSPAHLDLLAHRIEVVEKGILLKKYNFTEQRIKSHKFLAPSKLITYKPENPSNRVSLAQLR